MMNEKMIAIAVVLITVVAGGAGALYFMNSDNSSDDDKNIATGNLTVLGNADNDNNLDDNDIGTIRSIIDSGDWDKTASPLADANNDNTVDEKDITYLENLMKRSSAENTLMYYYNTWGDVDSIRFPVTGNIGTMYWEQADLAILLGLWDRVTAVGSGSLSDTKNPGWSSLYSYGKGWNADPEVVAKSYEDAGVTAVIAYIQSDGTAKDIKSYLEGVDSPIDLLCLPTSMNGRVVTAGVLLCAEERSEKYINYYDDIMQYMQDNIGNVTDAPSCVTVMLKANSDTGNIRFLNMSTNGESNGLYTYMKESPSEVYIVEPTTSYATHTDIEWLNGKNPDWIICCSSGAWTSGNTESANQAQFDEECRDIFGSTTAYSEKHILGTANGTMNSFFGCFAYLKLLSYMYDEIDSSYADRMIQNFFDEGFAYYNLDNMPSYKFYMMS